MSWSRRCGERLKQRAARVDEAGRSRHELRSKTDALSPARGAAQASTSSVAYERRRDAEELHICFHCAGELVYPLDWSEEGPRHWRIMLRCPECESRREGVFDQAAVERLDDELDRGSSALLGDLRRMTHANMAEEIEFFVARAGTPT